VVIQLEIGLPSTFVKGSPVNAALISYFPWFKKNS